jgi:hypothetical protein
MALVHEALAARQDRDRYRQAVDQLRGQAEMRMAISNPPAFAGHFRGP